LKKPFSYKLALKESMGESDLLMSAGFGLNFPLALVRRKNTWLCPIGRLDVPVSREDLPLRNRNLDNLI